MATLVQVKRGEHQCTFCGKAETEVKRLIGGGVLFRVRAIQRPRVEAKPRAYICDACIRLCYEIISEEQP